MKFDTIRLVEESYIHISHINLIGVVPKSTPCNFRLITNLSFPPGGLWMKAFLITTKKWWLHKMWWFCQHVSRIWNRLCVSDHQDWLGFIFHDQTFMDLFLYMGLTLTPKVAETFTTFREWMLRLIFSPKNTDYVLLTYFLDDVYCASVIISWSSIDNIIIIYVI